MRCTLESGVTLGYIVQQGEGETTKDVVAFHGMLSSKWMWLLPSPPPGVRMISIDRFGHGDSDEDPGDQVMTMEQELEYYLELMNTVGVREQFYLIGHSAGTTTCQCLAAKLSGSGRVLGVGLLGSFADCQHVALDVPTLRRVRKKVPRYSKLTKVARGGSCRKSMFGMRFNLLTPKNKSKDPGFAKKVRNLRKKSGGTKKKFDDFMNEPFIVASFLDSYLHGANSGKGSVGLVSRVYKGPWPFDVRTINAPVTCYHGDEDKAMSPLMPKIICTLVGENGKIVWLEGHGHTTMFALYPKILHDLIGIPMPGDEKPFRHSSSEVPRSSKSFNAGVLQYM